MGLTSYCVSKVRRLRKMMFKDNAFESGPCVRLFLSASKIVLLDQFGYLCWYLHQTPKHVPSPAKNDHNINSNIISKILCTECFTKVGANEFLAYLSAE